MAKTCRWIFVSSAIGAQGGWHYETGCGHNITMAFPSKCPYCGTQTAQKAFRDSETECGDGCPGCVECLKDEGSTSDRGAE